MPLSEQDKLNLQRKVEHYKTVLQNAKVYREIWQKELKKNIVAYLNALVESSNLPAQVQVSNDIQNLENIVLTLGTSKSGLAENAGNGLLRDLIKQNGALVYQQLFNGKILVLINLPNIEKYGQPQPPKTIAIYRPEELKETDFQRHVETFLNDITAWEDYDDNVGAEPHQRIGFKTSYEEEGQK